MGTLKEALILSANIGVDVTLADYEVRELVTHLSAAEKAERLLLDLTPGGSEFHGSPERCAQWIKERLSSTGKLAAERNRLRALNTALLDACMPFANEATLYLLADFTYRCACCNAEPQNVSACDFEHRSDCPVTKVREAIAKAEAADA